MKGQKTQKPGIENEQIAMIDYRLFFSMNLEAAAKCDSRFGETGRSLFNSQQSMTK